MTTRYVVVDLQASVASHLRQKSTFINPRYRVQDTQTREFVDECTTKRAAQIAARDLNRTVRTCKCGEPEDGGQFGFFDGPDNRTRCNACGSVVR